VNTRYKKISFGIGNRKSSEVRSRTPGPGAYYLPTKFDLIVKKYRNNSSMDLGNSYMMNESVAK
jgi:hypothetical protein